ncbi:3-deoxy-8-phosphooctulonate synthase [Sinorhizobium terangae]|uniref:2-dehydro-3-deoxyphosphooctonate aldolase n=1 Tax=Sinorhizobium terangae TaxID=110322 RepID=A0A6N7L9M3_SINTE|nr:3-deoxy-8-phosphooctulonate synthase [Sinorhizobium terangae]MQX13444.1 3-deoxy-8-phosphooctulonate synthase [Sinorhizobium terangae]
MSVSSRGVAVKTIKLTDIEFSNSNPMVLIGGVNVLESRDLTLRVAEAMQQETARRQMPYIFKASFDKANRSSNQSYRGPGIEEGMKILHDVRECFGLPILTDIHLPEQASVAAEVCDILQLPAFLARQTDLIAALARTGKIVNVKKPQFMSPTQIGNVIAKFDDFGNDQVIICERGSCFGYDNLVVDMLGFSVMKEVSGGAPIIFDVTHSLQMRDPSAKSSGGRREQALELARSALALGLAGIFLEAHPDPDQALCDGPSALPLEKLPAFLDQMRAVDDVVKSFSVVTLS